VVFAAVDIQEDASAVRRFLSERQLTPLTLLDRSGSVSESYAVNGIPHTVIIAQDGTVAEILVGYRPSTPGVIRETVERLLESTTTSGDSVSSPRSESSVDSARD